MDSRPASLFVRATIDRPVGLLMLFIGLLVVGLMAYPRIPVQLAPRGLSGARCSVMIPVQDATPREVMEEIAKPCEDALRVIPGIDRVDSTSGARRCQIRLRFAAGLDVQLLLAEVRDQLDRAKASWPEGVDRYFLWRHDESDLPVYVAAMSIDVDEEKVDVDHIFDVVIRRRLEAIDGVAKVDVWGLLDKRAEIGLDPDQVDAHGVPLHTLIQRLQKDNQRVSIGNVRDGEKELFVVADGRFDDFESILEYPADERFRVKDIAEVNYIHAVKEHMSRVNGHPSRIIVVKKASSANTVEVCQRLEEAFNELERDLSRTVPTLTRIDAHAWLDQGKMINFSVRSLQANASWGGLFAVAVLYVFFRRIGMTILVTFAIPFSMLIAVIWIFLSGGSFNLLSLMGLSLGVGMLVDNSIVVVENILRQREHGRSPRDAAIFGTREVGLAVTLATLTTVMVFLPIIFLADPKFKVIATEIGLPVCVSVLASLLVALVFIPQGSLIGRRMSREGAGSAKLAPRARGKESFALPNRMVCRGIHWCLAHRVETVLVALSLMAVAFKAFENLPKKAIDTQGKPGLEMSVSIPHNSTLRESDEIFAKVEAAILAHKEKLRLTSLTSWYSTEGGEVSMYFPLGERIDEDAFFPELRAIVPRLPGVSYRMGHEAFDGPTHGHRIRVYVQGPDLDTLEELGAAVRADLENATLFPELTEVSRWRESHQQEIRVEVNRRMAQERGIDTSTVSRTVAWALRGARLPDFYRQDREFPLWIAYEGGPRASADDLRSIRVFSSDGQVIPLDTVASYSMVPGLGQIHRINGTMTVAFSASTTGSPESLPALRDRLQRHFDRFPVPEGFGITLRRSDSTVEADMHNALLALGMAFSLVFFLMGILFESFVLPLSVLAAVPFAFFGSILLLWAMEVSLDVVAMIGMLMLVGIVVNNAIVLVDYVNRVRSTESNRTTAILRACEVRFRPIWMTALTTICGLLPLLLFPQKGEGVDYKPLAIVLIGGLATSTFFTLFLVPLLYTMLDDLRIRVARMARLSGRRLWRDALPRGADMTE